MANGEFRLYSDDEADLPPVPLVYRFCSCPLGCLKPLCFLDEEDVEDDMCVDCRIGNCVCFCIGCDSKGVLKRRSGKSGACSRKRARRTSKASSTGNGTRNAQ